jgi:hypothetical protein
LECSWAFSWQCTLSWISTLPFGTWNFIIHVFLSLCGYSKRKLFGFCSIILKVDLIWYGSLRRCRKGGYMFISALDLMSVQNGILGTWNFCSFIFLFL